MQTSRIVKLREISQVADEVASRIIEARFEIEYVLDCVKNDVEAGDIGLQRWADSLSKALDHLA